uniref:A-kinase anchoring protein 14 n=1 Tax=Pipistrellus kuhlii TaxID=59472 RepID=A0A7J7UM07_PIPKU|nr:A-kinase anchoring protein 14 [Pipistrellus kuhlii]
MKRTRSIRFNNVVNVYKEFPIPLIDKEDTDAIEPATDNEDSDVTEPAKVEEHTEETEEAMGKEESNVTEPAMDEHTDKTEEAMDKEESDVTEPAMDEEVSDVTEPAMETESNEIEPAMETESSVTEQAMDTDINFVTEPAMHTDSYGTESAAIGRGSSVTGPAVVIDSNALEPAIDTEDDHVNDIALDLAENVIAAALNIVEDDEYTIRNINWLTHGEFTPDKCRRQIEDFVKNWEYQERWVHYTKLIEKRDLVHSFHYIYSVRWSVPTSQTPTAFSSAFAFFTVKFNKNKPPDAPIEISYIFEGQSLIHRPGTTRFRENWVKEMVVAKHNIMKSFPF